MTHTGRWPIHRASNRPDWHYSGLCELVDPSAGAGPSASLIQVPSAVRLLERFSVSPEADARARQGYRRQRQITLFFNRHCSHGCLYCVSKSPQASRIRLKQIIDEIGGKAYLGHILRLVGDTKVRFGFNGPGECAEHPDFEYVLHGILAAGHHVYIQTHGFTSRAFERILASYPRDFVAENVSFGLSFHYGAYIDQPGRKRLDAYLNDHYPRIVRLGAPIRLIVPLTPKVLAAHKFEQYLVRFWDMADAAGVDPFWFDLVELQGEYDGRKYPAAFSDNERQRIVALIRRYGGREKTDMVEEDISRLAGPLYLKGLPCYICTHVIEITPSGVLRHCLSSPQGSYGKLTDAQPGIGFTEGPIMCPYDKCLCKTAGIRNCLGPLDVPLREYFREIDRDIAGLGKDYAAFFDLLSGEYQHTQLTPVAVPWATSGPHEVTWLAANFHDGAPGVVKVVPVGDARVVELKMPVEGNLKVFPRWADSTHARRARPAKRPGCLWGAVQDQLLLPPGAYLIRFRASGRGRLQFLAQVSTDNQWANFLVRSYDVSDEGRNCAEAVFIQGEDPRAFRPVFSLTHPGRAFVEDLKLLRAV